MKILIKTSIGGPFLRLYFMAIALGLLALAPGMRAVIPPPGGGYPGANTAEGQDALLSLTTGGWNTAIGFESLRTNTAGQFNTGVGAGTLYGNTGNQNTALGAVALFSNTTGSDNTAAGFEALFSNTTGYGNTATGIEALDSNTTGYNNIAIGTKALLHNTTGFYNTAVGQEALANCTTGSYNMALGPGAGENVISAHNVICIGMGISAGGANVSNSCYIGNIFGSTSSNGAAVLVNSNGRLGTMTSSARFKEAIKPMDKASETILTLRPVSFRYKKEIDPQGIREFGLVAEEVEKVNPDLIVRDKDGKPYSVLYDQVNAMLLNEFLKEHRKVEAQERKIGEQEATISELKKDLQTVVARLTDQDSKIQRVNAELEMSKRSGHVVATNP